MKENHRIAG